MFDRRYLLAFTLAPLLAVPPLACGSASSQLGALGDDGGLSGGDGALNPNGDGASANGDGAGGPGTGSTCGGVGTACASGGDCCSTLCLGGQCTSSIGACAPASAACSVGTDCCSGACVNGACVASQCVTIGDSCPTSGNACCTATCVGGKCAPIGGGGSGDGGKGGSSCTTAGNTCKANTDCCSGLCSANGTCDIASSYCVQPNDICYHAADCCTGVCQAPNGSAVSPTNPGTCGAPPSSGGVNCTAVDGTLCDPTQVGCAAGCCSALCAPFGPTGIAICQQAQGCHVEGDLCRKDNDCCGGESPDAGVLGGGLVVCSTSVNGGTIGVCMTPTGGNGGGNACVPEGDVCHFAGTGYACPSTTKRADCCGPQTPKYLACQLDTLGVPRCLAYGLDDGGACRQVGNTCATAADCCNGAPCVPDATGQLTCATTACIPTSGACTSSADCCAGITCVVPVGATKGTCASVPPPASGDGGTGTGGSDGGSGTGGDAGTGGGGGLGCASLGQSCASLGCCTGLSCLGGICQLPAK